MMCDDVLECIVDGGSLQEYKADYGKTIVTAFATISGMPVGIVANQRIQTHDRARRSGDRRRHVYRQRRQGCTFRYGLQSDAFASHLFPGRHGLYGRQRSRAVRALSVAEPSSSMPSATPSSQKSPIIIGNSFGAGNYALCGKAYDPHFIFAWPNAKYAVMGADQAADTLMTVQKKAAERKGTPLLRKPPKKSAQR